MKNVLAVPLWFVTAYACVLIVPYMEPVGKVIHIFLVVPVALFIVWAVGVAGAVL
jgi:hypothetical protein